MTLEQRYKNAVKALGGPLGLLNFPEKVNEVLKNTTNLEVKTKMLELIVSELSK